MMIVEWEGEKEGHGGVLGAGVVRQDEGGGKTVSRIFTAWPSGLDDGFG